MKHRRGVGIEAKSAAQLLLQCREVEIMRLIVQRIPLQIQPTQGRHQHPVLSVCRIRRNDSRRVRRDDAASLSRVSQANPQCAGSDLMDAKTLPRTPAHGRTRRIELLIHRHSRHQRGAVEDRVRRVGRAAFGGRPRHHRGIETRCEIGERPLGGLWRGIHQTRRGNEAVVILKRTARRLQVRLPRATGQREARISVIHDLPPKQRADVADQVAIEEQLLQLSQTGQRPDVPQLVVREAEEPQAVELRQRRGVCQPDELTVKRCSGERHLDLRPAIGRQRLELLELRQPTGVGELSEIETEVFQISKPDLITKRQSDLDGVRSEKRDVHHFIARQAEHAKIRGEFQSRNIGQVQPAQVQPGQRDHLRRGDGFMDNGRSAIGSRDRQTERLSECDAQRFFVDIRVDGRIQRTQ